jgi:hypothetical protein
MMNNARLNVGLQGVQVAEAATQQAVAYALDRVQSARTGATSRESVAIVEHPDVRRMLLRMKAQTQAARALVYYAAGQVDRAALGDAAARDRLEVVTPLAKAHGTDLGNEVASLGIQVHGGMGYIEETGAAQFFRDARITPIYEGTNGIQAADLVGRKLALLGGEAFASLIADMRRDAEHEDLKVLVETCELVGNRLSTAGHDDRLAASYPSQFAAGSWSSRGALPATTRSGRPSGLASISTLPKLSRKHWGCAPPRLPAPTSFIVFLPRPLPYDL